MRPHRVPHRPSRRTRWLAAAGAVCAAVAATAGCTSPGHTTGSGPWDLSRYEFAVYTSTYAARTMTDRTSGHVILFNQAGEHRTVTTRGLIGPTVAQAGSQLVFQDFEADYTLGTSLTQTKREHKAAGSAGIVPLGDGSYLGLLNAYADLSDNSYRYVATLRRGHTWHEKRLAHPVSFLTACDGHVYAREALVGSFGARDTPRRLFRITTSGPPTLQQVGTHRPSAPESLNLDQTGTCHDGAIWQVRTRGGDTPSDDIWLLRRWQLSDHSIKDIPLDGNIKSHPRLGQLHFVNEQAYVFDAQNRMVYRINTASGKLTTLHDFSQHGRSQLALGAFHGPHFFVALPQPDRQLTMHRLNLATGQVTRLGAIPEVGTYYLGGSEASADLLVLKH